MHRTEGMMVLFVPHQQIEHCIFTKLCDLDKCPELFHRHRLRVPVPDVNGRFADIRFACKVLIALSLHRYACFNVPLEIFILCCPGVNQICFWHCCRLLSMVAYILSALLSFCSPIPIMYSQAPARAEYERKECFL